MDVSTVSKKTRASKVRSGVIKRRACGEPALSDALPLPYNSATPESAKRLLSFPVDIFRVIARFCLPKDALAFSTTCFLVFMRMRAVRVVPLVTIQLYSPELHRIRAFMRSSSILYCRIRAAEVRVFINEAIALDQNKHCTIEAYLDRCTDYKTLRILPLFSDFNSSGVPALELDVSSGLRVLDTPFLFDFVELASMQTILPVVFPTSLDLVKNFKPLTRLLCSGKTARLFPESGDLFVLGECHHQLCDVLDATPPYTRLVITASKSHFRALAESLKVTEYPALQEIHIVDAPYSRALGEDYTLRFDTEMCAHFKSICSILVQRTPNVRIYTSLWSRHVMLSYDFAGTTMDTFVREHVLLHEAQWCLSTSVVRQLVLQSITGVCTVPAEYLQEILTYASLKPPMLRDDSDAYAVRVLSRAEYTDILTTVFSELSIQNASNANRAALSYNDMCERLKSEAYAHALLLA